ncbi:YigZ family protein [Clostridium sp. SYSU_GA19001]|uniref:YigZ family protein n=1 Tax=Clostridium caldaquaticum TaxID=2940653 RepID=UPI0020770B2E|nr:YigZ family protein [Clostridium caldaquaticum]MCM8710891.1 YigZ family protein [Clostridium caldaquaticum]
MSYFTIKDEVSSKFEERKSIFIGHAKRVYNEEEAKAFINKIRNEHKEATHNVYAYVIGENFGIQRYSDDGEPQGTAGVPVLEVIKKNSVTDIAVVVTRYFGGVLLGAGGLVRAYSKGAAMAIKDAGIVEKVKGCRLDITADYDLLGKIQYVCSQKSWYIENVEYFDKVKITTYCEISSITEIKSNITETTSGRAVMSTSEEGYYFKLENRLFKEC